MNKNNFANSGIFMKTISSLYKFIFLSAFLFCVSAYPQTNKIPYTMEAQVELNVPAGPVISPDGSKVLFTIKKANLTTSEWNTQVYLFNVKAKNYAELTDSGKSCTSPAFSPDGKWITFISARKYKLDDSGKTDSKESQLWAEPSAGGETVRWTSLPGGGICVVQRLKKNCGPFGILQRGTGKRKGRA